MTKKFYILTHGCQMNKNDSERIASLLFDLGLKETKQPEKADLLIVNTCSVRQSAEDKVFGIIRNWQKLRVAKPNLVIAVTGCMPGRDQDGKISTKLPGVDLFFPIHELILLPKRLSSLCPYLCADINHDRFEDLTAYLSLSPARTENYRAYITIQTGCDNYCSYCVVPFARGRTKNRLVKDVLAETRQAIKNGAKEIVLLGQVVNKYLPADEESFSKDNPFVISNSRLSREEKFLSQSIGRPARDPDLHRDDRASLTAMPCKLNKDSSPKQGRGKPSARTSVGMTSVVDGFAALLWEINQIPGEFRVHFTAPDPQFFCDAQIEALKLPKQVNFLHLPVQSGNNAILKKMNRKYTREQYIDLIKKIKKTCPEIAIATDIIVGFCGETDAQFNDTVDLFKKCEFDISYHARYSQRSGTLAAKMFKDDVSVIDKKNRWEILQKLMEEITIEKNRKYLGQVLSVLVEKCEEGVCSGYSNEMKLTQFLGGSELVGKIAKVKINWTDTWLLRGNCEVVDK